MSGNQSTLGRVSPGLLSRPARYSIVDEVLDRIQSVSSDVGVPTDFFGARPGEIDDDVGFFRWQYSTTYTFQLRDRKTDDTKYGQVQFRTYVVTMTPPSAEFKTYIKDYNHRRLHTLFETGEYDSYMSGFGFIDDSENVESIDVGHDEVPPTGLGVPNFTVEIYNNDTGAILGYAKGYSMDFGVHEKDVQTKTAPEHEVWDIFSWNPARGDYELGPEGGTPARQRAKGAAGKTAYINGLPIGAITSRGTVWLTKEHTSPARATYRSRSYITSNTGAPYQALSKGANLYKVGEDASGVYLSTTKPKDYQPTEAADVSPEETGLVDVEKVLDFDEDEPTTFVVTEDVAEQWALGRYNAPVTRDIDYETYFNIGTNPRGQRV